MSQHQQQRGAANPVSGEEKNEKSASQCHRTILMMNDEPDHWHQWFQLMGQYCRLNWRRMGDE